jgi:hypothetical protein
MRSKDKAPALSDLPEHIVENVMCSLHCLPLTDRPIDRSTLGFAAFLRPR